MKHFLLVVPDEHVPALFEAFSAARVHSRFGVQLTPIPEADRHIVNIADGDWTIQHPIQERVDGGLFRCTAINHLARMSYRGGDAGIPAQPGRYYLDFDADSGEWAIADPVDPPTTEGTS